jgi:Zeta toxin
VEHRPAIYLITGPMAAGKSTVARLLAGRFERGVHVEGDVFRWSIVSGREEMTRDASPEALAQLELRYRLGAAAADAYFEAGFTVALEDVVAGPLLGDYQTMINGRPCHVIVLAPSRQAVAEREAGRERPALSPWRSAAARLAEPWSVTHPPCTPPPHSSTAPRNPYEKRKGHDSGNDGSNSVRCRDHACRDHEKD